MLAITGALLFGIFVPLQTQIESRRLEETERMLEQAREALLVYAAYYGRFPCPADSASAGREPAAGVDESTGACPSFHGFLPAALIGFTPLDDGFAVDPWGSASNRLRYAVSSDTVGGLALPFTRTGGMAAAGVTGLGTASGLLYICNSGSGVVPATNCGTSTTLAANAVAVVWSVGANGANGGSSMHEAENPNPNGGSADRIFVNRRHSTASGVEFDDLLTWISAPVLVSRLLATGKLP